MLARTVVQKDHRATHSGLFCEDALHYYLQPGQFQCRLVDSFGVA